MLWYGGKELNGDLATFVDLAHPQGEEKTLKMARADGCSDPCYEWA